MFRDKERLLGDNLISPEVREWDIFKPQTPIKISEIPNCQTLLNWHPVDPGMGHYGYDIAAYIAKTEGGLEVALGLPKHLAVYAIADGVVCQIRTYHPHLEDSYKTFITMRHEFPKLTRLLRRKRRKRRFFSDYGHIIPEVEIGQEVKAGDRIGKLYADSDWGDELGHLVHLHIQTRNGPSVHEYVDPTLIVPEISGPRCIPPEEISGFEVEGYGKLPIRITNYKQLKFRKIEGR